ncbi:MAG: phosphorybosylanthranilate isomerase [Ignavibacteria bacterium]|nr:MAG: phosphorybosylanthranilate isomerase [Ignavibacteria bacterium]
MSASLSSIRLIGMVHLQALPGSPGYAGSRAEVAERALRDALALQNAGFDAVLVENYGDAPFAKTDAGRHVTADMTAVISTLMREIDLPLGVQVLRNDVRAGLAIAAATGARFVRVNVHTGVMQTDQGIIEGNAHDTLRYRNTIDARHVEILADVFVKHAAPLAPSSFTDAVRDTVERGLADGVIVSGSGTGEAADLEQVKCARDATGVPVFVGSGVRRETLLETLALAHGVIVGTAIKSGRMTQAPVDAEESKLFVEDARRFMG